MLGVNVVREDAETVSRFAKRNQLTYPMLLDGHTIRRDWGVRRIPATFFIDREGNVVKKSFGFTEKDIPHLEEMVVKLLNSTG